MKLLQWSQICKLSNTSNHLGRQLEQEHEFITATSMAQAKHVQQLHKLMSRVKDSMLLMETNTTIIDKAASGLRTTSHSLVQVSESIIEAIPMLQQSNPPTNTLTSFTESVKMLSEVVGDLKAHVLPYTPISQQPESCPPQPSYANIVANPPQNRAAHYNLNMPEYVTRIENRLHIQERQVSISFDKEAEDSPTERGGPATYALCEKLNEHLCALDQETNQVSLVVDQHIKSLQITENNTILLEFVSSKSTEHFKQYCNDNTLLSCICSTAKIWPHLYCLVIKFVLCNGSFSPENQDQLCQIEIDHSLETRSIVATSWIKIPELCSPNQKTANVKLACSSPMSANKLLSERVFIANSRVV